MSINNYIITYRDIKSMEIKGDTKQLPKILRKFDKQRQRKKGLYTKAYEIMSAITHVLQETQQDFSSTAYFVSLASMYQSLQSSVNQEALAYSFSAVVSMLDLSLIQHQHTTIFEIIVNHLLSPTVESPQVGKYGIIALQFLLHSKTEAQWNSSTDTETERAFSMVMHGLIDKREKVQKQSQKSLCILLQNKQIEKLVRPLAALQTFVSSVFNQQLSTQSKGSAAMLATKNSIMVLNFLAAALQLMPLSLCADIDSKVLRLTTVDDSYLKTNAYLTLEVLYASRRFHSNAEHVEQMLKQMLENQEVLSAFRGGLVSGGEHEETRVIAYIQSATQVMMNLGTAQGVTGDRILRYVSACFSVFCEYLLNSTLRIRNAAFMALRLILQQCLKREYFSGQEHTSEILSFDAMSLAQEINNFRRGGQSHQQLTNADKLIIHLRYLLTTRFEDSQDLALKLMKTFVLAVGSSLKDSGDLLVAVSQIKVAKESYKPWISCIGSFLTTVGCKRFFEALPLNLLSFDMTSQTFAQDSRSYLLPLVKEHLAPPAVGGDLAFFVQYFLPMILQLEQKRLGQINSKDGSEIKAKKYEALIVQIWDLLPNFCRYNSPQLSSAFATLIGYLEPMINQNLFGLRTLALRVFSELISHCRTTKEVTIEIKATRLGLQRIAHDYLAGLSKLYLQTDSPLSDQDRSQLLTTLQDFASIAKSVRMSNQFLLDFANLLTRFQPGAAAIEGGLTEVGAQRELDVMRAMMEKVKLKKENYVSLMKGLKVFIQCAATQKQAYKLLAKIIEKYELENIGELMQIQKELNPMLLGQASKQRVMLIQSYVTQLSQFKDGQETSIAGILDLLKLVIIDLIGGYSSSNNKLRALSEQVFGQIYDILSTLKALPQLFQLVLVGFAGTKSSTQSATIRSLMLLMKLNYHKKGIDVTEASFQDLLRKVSKIVALFLKDERAENEVHRASLRFLKTAVAFLATDQIKGELAEQILAHGVFSLPPAKRNKHGALIRKLVGKLLKKLGSPQVRKITPAKHHPLLDYIERARRKRLNKVKKLKLMALLGKEMPPAEETKEKNAGEDSDSDDEMDSGDEDREERYSDKGGDSSSDSESESENEEKDTDKLLTDGLDIPRVDNIPVVSKLAKEKKIEQSGKAKSTQLADTKDKVTQLMDAEADAYESHFVENPFIRMRERALQKQHDSKVHLSAKQLLQTDEDNEVMQDIVMIKETGKFLINDLEMAAPKKIMGKRARMEISKEDADVSSADESEEEGDLKEKMKEMTKRQRTGTDGRSQGTYKQSEGLNKRFNKKGQVQQTSEAAGGHIVKYSASAYKSTKGAGDTLKAGKYEPFAYIQLNPKMLNKRNKTKAIKSFEGVVSHGKKIDKRKGNSDTGMLSGIGLKKKQQ